MSEDKEQVEVESGVDEKPRGTAWTGYLARIERRQGLWVGVVAVVIAAFLLGRACATGTAAVDEHAGHEHADEGAASEYVCPMHPQVRQSEPGTCPICFMDLVPVESGSAGGDVPGVSLTPGAKALARVQTSKAEAVEMARSVRVYGRVEVNETAEVDLTAWAGGRIERLYVQAVGEKVKKGQRLARIYSPDLLAAQQTLVQAARNLESAQESGSEMRARAAQAGLEAARTELRLLGMSRNQIEAVLKKRKAQEFVDIFATSAGTVRERVVSQGDWVQPGGRVLSLMALDTVWVQLDVYERDLHFVQVGQTVRLSIPALSQEAAEGEIAFIDPVIDAQKRVARARVVLKNADAQLRPGMFVTASIEAPVLDGDHLPLSVPATSVLWTGTRSLVYRVEEHDGEPVYVPAPVVLGARVGERFVIKEGLSAGDEVVTNGAFRVDASLQIRGGPTMMSTEMADPSGHANHAPGEPLPKVEVSAEGAEFDPPVQAEQLPDDVWYCDMGTVHYARGEEGDGTCPLCNMKLKHKPAGGDDDSERDGGEHAH